MRVAVRAPATTANLGAGFDVFGAALALENLFTIETGREGFRLKGVPVQPDLGRNLFHAALDRTAAELGGQAPKVAVTVDVAVPLRSGLGSSASAICAGVAAAQVLLSKHLAPAAALRIAAELDGHPDNVAACLFGGVTIATDDGLVRRLPAPDLRAIVFYPGTELGTEAARRSLGREVLRADAVFNLGRASLLVYAFALQDYDLLSAACEDRLHEPQRLPALPYAQEAREAALSAGALAMPISGSGPSLLALARPAQADAVALALQAVAARHAPARVLDLAFADRGTEAQALD